MTPDQQSIVAAALQAGIDPATALAVAERESSFNPRARSSKTIAGDFQMSGPLRKQFGGADADSADPGTQAAMWSKFFRQNRYDMRQVLGRDPTDEEGYLGHHFGSVRAARMLKMDPNTPVDQVFTPNEMALNPHFGRAGTVGALNSSVLADMSQRHKRWSDQMPDFSGEAEGAPDKPDFSKFGTPVSGTEVATADSPAPLPAPQSTAGGSPSPPAEAPDLSQYGTPA